MRLRATANFSVEHRSAVGMARCNGPGSMAASRTPDRMPGHHDDHVVKSKVGYGNGLVSAVAPHAHGLGESGNASDVTCA